MMARTAEFRDDISGTLTTAGTSTAFTVATFQVFNTLANLDNRVLCIVPHTTSGASPTLAVDGLTAKQIRTVSGTNVPTGSLIAGSPYFVIYDNGVGEFILVNAFTATMIAAGAITTAAIADANVTYAKIQNVAASRLLGNPTVGAAAPSEISLGAGLVFSGTTLKTGGVPTRQRFTSGSSTYTTPAGATWLRIRIGGGAGGGGGSSGSGPTNGGNGSASSFGSTTVGGGTGGGAASAGGGAGGGAGGSGGSTGTGTEIVRFSGAIGSSGVSSGSGSSSGSGGGGGSSPFGGAPGMSNGSAPAPAANSCSGGGGGGNLNAINLGGGGGGGAGEYVEFFIGAPIATYAYTVGGGGTGGGGGGNGSAGAAGIVIVEEFYN